MDLGGLGGFGLLGLLMAVLGVKVIAEIVRNRAQIFDDNLTPQDRHSISQAAFFAILPITVAFHELGHAALVKLFGAEITSWGFYFFSGFVGYRGFVSEEQQILIAAAGVTVNLLMGAIAIAVVFLKRPPMRPAINELLIQATAITVVNALIFYPLLDFVTDLNGDFRQMYFGGVPWLSASIFSVHAAVLIGGYAASRNERVATRLAELTGLPPYVRRGLLGGVRVDPEQQRQMAAQALTPAEAAMQAAARRVASGWLQPVEGVLVRQPHGPALLLRWSYGGAALGVAAMTEPAGSVVITIPHTVTDPRAALGAGQVVKRWASPPSEDELMLALRLGMENAERHATQRSAAPSVVGS